MDNVLDIDPHRFVVGIVNALRQHLSTSFLPHRLRKEQTDIEIVRWVDDRVYHLHELIDRRYCRRQVDRARRQGEKRAGAAGDRLTLADRTDWSDAAVASACSSRHDARSGHVEVAGENLAVVRHVSYLLDCAARWRCRTPPRHFPQTGRSSPMGKRLDITG